MRDCMRELDRAPHIEKSAICCLASTICMFMLEIRFLRCFEIVCENIVGIASDLRIHLGGRLSNSL